MKRDQIIEMAREAGFIQEQNGVRVTLKKDTDMMSNLEAFAKLVAQAERDACAKVCDDHGKVWADRFLFGFQATLDDAAKAIRART